jgi:hypothetical protein
MRRRCRDDAFNRLSPALFSLTPLFSRVYAVEEQNAAGMNLDHKKSKHTDSYVTIMQILAVQFLHAFSLFHFCSDSFRISWRVLLYYYRDE